MRRYKVVMDNKAYFAWAHDSDEAAGITAYALGYDPADYHDGAVVIAAKQLIEWADLEVGIRL